jgi:hypothetical protein
LFNRAIEAGDARAANNLAAMRQWRDQPDPDGAR